MGRRGGGTEVGGIRQVNNRARRGGLGETPRQCIIGVWTVRVPPAERHEAVAPVDGEPADIVEGVEQHRIEGRLQHDLARPASGVGQRFVGV